MIAFTQGLCVSLLFGLLAANTTFCFSAMRQTSAVISPADRQVLDTVLDALLRHPDFPDRRPVQGRAFHLVLVEQTPDQPPVRVGFQGDRPDDGPVPLPSLTRTLMEALMTRNRDRKGQPVQHRWTGYRPRSRRIVMRDLDAATLRQAHHDDRFWKRWPDAKGFVWAWLPGYSPDGRTALVEYLVGPATVNGGLHGFCLLTRREGKWRIQEQHLGPPPLS